MSDRILSILFFLLLISGCAKVEEGTFVPESLEYIPESSSTWISQDKSSIKTFVNYSPVTQSDNFYYTVKYDNQNTDYPRIITSQKNVDYGLLDQINFSKTDFPDIVDAHLVPFLTDLNSNKSLDYVYFLKYKDSIVIAYYDMLLEKGKRWFFSKNIFRTKRQYIRCLYTWHTLSGNKILVFLKSNRLVLSNEIILDTLYGYDILRKRILFKKPIGYKAYGFSNYEKDFLGDILYLRTYDAQNGHTYQGYNDSYQYLIALDTLGNTIWSEVLCGPEKCNIYGIVSYLYNFNAPLFATKIIDSTLFLCQFNKKTGQILKKIRKEKDLDILGYYKDPDSTMCFLCLQNNFLQKRNLDLSIICEYKYPEYSTILMNSYSAVSTFQSVGKVHGHFFCDIDNDDYQDFFLQTVKNQVIVVSGKNLEPLIASQPLEHPAGYSFLTDRNGEIKILLSTYYNYIIYQINKTGVFERISPYKVETAIIFFLLFIAPLLFFSFRKIQYQRALFLNLTSMSLNQGIVVLNNKGHIMNINSKANDIILHNGKANTINDYPEDFQLLFNEAITKQSNIIKEIIIAKEKDQHILSSITKFKPIMHNSFYILTINDVTNIANEQQKRDMLTTAIMIAHGVKSSLGTAKLQINQLQKNLKDEKLQNPEYYHNSSELISQSISEAADTIRRINYVAKEISEINLEKISLYYFFIEWLDNHEMRYINRGIKFINNIDEHLPPLYLEKNSLDLMLLTICDNSVESMPYKQKQKLIEFSVEKNEKELLLKISDNGIGMDEITIERIMKNPGYSTKRTGSGLGLQLIHKVVSAHNAKLNIQSKQNSGTTIIIKFLIPKERS